MTYPWLQAVEAEFAERRAGGRMPHALLVSGPVDTGKRELAVGLVASLLCLEGSLPACGECRSCRLLSSGAHPDRHVISYEEHPQSGELRKELVIDQIRRLIGSLQLTTTISERKAALIHPAEAMNRHAANALLKTLEEPPGDTVLILVSHDPARMPATLRSRCQNLRVRLPDTGQALDWLRGAAPGQAGETEAALQAAAGSPLKALRMLEDGGTEQYRLVIGALEGLRAGRLDPRRAMDELADVDPALLWSWLSLSAAERVREAVAAGASAKPVSRLQTAADRGRMLLPSPVRKDLLLQDWLIQWARIGS